MSWTALRRHDTAARAYDALRQTFPLSDSPDILVDAMQAGDRLGYTEQAQEEIVRFHKVLRKLRPRLPRLIKAWPAYEGDGHGCAEPTRLDARRGLIGRLTKPVSKIRV